jgi:hypothetical protein
MFGRPDTPNVYVETVDATRGQIAALRTDITGFVGIADRGPVGVAVPCRSKRQFESIFGSYIGGGYLAYAVRAFFENGGKMCRVVRIAAVEAAVASARIRLADGRFGLTLQANSAGTWGDLLTVRVSPSRGGETMSLPTGTIQTTPVVATQGFEAGALVRIRQGGAVAWRILADVDPANRTLHWTHPDPAQRQPWEQPLSGIDLGAPFRVERIDYDFTVRESGRLVSVHAALTPVEVRPRYAPDILRLPAPLTGQVRDEERLLEAQEPPPPVIASIADGSDPSWGSVPTVDAAGTTLALSGGADGLALLAPADFLAGMAVLERCEDVAILACPDILIQPLRVERDPRPIDRLDPCEPCVEPPVVAAPPPLREPELPPLFDLASIQQVQAAMIDQCERLGDRVALIDPPFSASKNDSLGHGPVQAWRSRFDSGFGALYHPWLGVPDPLSRGGLRLVPPSGHVAGQYADFDTRLGVHHAAADEPLSWVQSSSMRIDKERHGLLNSAGVNVITGREGRTLRILGARTMSSDPTWRFVPVRRLVCMLRDVFDVSTQWAAFEPNNDETRALLQSNIDLLLNQLWMQGALVGATADEAFRVRCDEVNNDATRRANGELHIDVAIAPAVPLEFIILRIGRQGNSFELIEDGAISATTIGGTH